MAVAEWKQNMWHVIMANEKHREMKEEAKPSTAWK